MISTKEKIFACRKDLAKWQTENCNKCKKAIDGQRAVCYRCALQRDIEKQQEDRHYAVNVRSLTLIKGTDICPLLRKKSEDEEVPTNAAKRPKIEEKSQNKANRDRYIIRDGDKEYEVSVGDYAKAEKKVLDAIWDKGMKHAVIDPFSRFQHAPRLSDDMIKIVANHDADALLRTFSWDDCMQIAFVPLVISKIAWEYAERAMKQCADMKITQYIKLCREIKALRKKYIDFILLDLNRSQLDKVEDKASQLMNLCEYDFTILWFQINQYIKTNAYSISYDKMRTDALIAIVIVRFLKEHDERMNAIVSKKLMISKSVTNPMMIRLSKLLKDFFPKGFAFGTNSQIDMCDKIFHNNLKKLVFEQVDKSTNVKL